MFRTLFFLIALFALPFVFKYFLVGLLPIVSLLLAIALLGKLLD